MNVSVSFPPLPMPSFMFYALASNKSAHLFVCLSSMLLSGNAIDVIVLSTLIILIGFFQASEMLFCLCASGHSFIKWQLLLVLGSCSSCFLHIIGEKLQEQG